MTLECLFYDNCVSSVSQYNLYKYMSIRPLVIKQNLKHKEFLPITSLMIVMTSLHLNYNVDTSNQSESATYCKTSIVPLKHSFTKNCIRKYENYQKERVIFLESEIFLKKLRWSFPFHRSIKWGCNTKSSCWIKWKYQKSINRQEVWCHFNFVILKRLFQRII